MKWDDIGDQPCSVARMLSVIGDRWTMLILRNAFMGIRRFDDFQKSLGVTRHVLSDRLKSASKLSKSCLFNHSGCSGMQYTHLKLQRSVTEIRNFRLIRPYWSCRTDGVFSE